MCEMEHDEQTRDPEGWTERHYYGDSGDPMREAIRAVSLTELKHADVTIPEAVCVQLVVAGLVTMIFRV